MTVAAPRSTAARSTDAIRADFPALARRHEGHPVAYFDGPGGTQVPRAVGNAMTDYLYHHNANTHWAYPTSIETDAMIEASRAAVADFLNASPREVKGEGGHVLAEDDLARGLGRGWGPGDEVVITELDHHANVAPWRALEVERGITIRVVRMDPATGRLDWDDLAAALTERVRLLAIGAASNALGTITDVAAATRMAHAVGAQVFVDAVHYAPHALVDVQAIDCDYLACSAYKFYGPHIGILYGRQALLDSVDAPRLAPAPSEAPERLETGTGNHEGMVGAAAAVDYLASIGGDGHASRRAALVAAFDVLHARGEELVARMWAGLEAIPGVTLYGPPPGSPRTPTVGFTIEGIDTTRAAIELAKRGLFVSNGDFYAQTVVERIGRAQDGLVRAGCSCYTTTEEINALITVLSSER